MSICAPRQASAKGEKLAHRLSHILAQLHQGDVVDKHRLAQDFQVNVRTIERDLGERLYGIAERTAEGRWQLTLAARATIPARHLGTYARLVGAEHLFPDSSLRYLLEQLETQPPAQHALSLDNIQCPVVPNNFSAKESNACPVEIQADRLQAMPQTPLAGCPPT